MNTQTHRKLTVLLGALALGAACQQVRADDFHVANAQQLQNALFVSATNGADNTIWLTNGYYTGNFNYNSSVAHNLTVLPEPGVTNTQVVLDGAGTGRDMNLTDTVGNDITVQGITFLRNCGNTSIGALRIAAGPAASVLVQNCLFLSPSNSSGMGLEIASGQNAVVSGCTAVGSTTGGSGTGISISGVSGNVSVQSCAFSTNNASTALLGWSANGGLNVSPGASLVVITNNNFTGNVGGGAGGGGTAVRFAGNVFAGNSGGGANTLRAGNSPYTVTVCGNTFIGNSGGGAGLGAGDSLTVTDNNFTGNSGGGASGGAGNVTLSNNTFTGNSGSSGSGASFNGSTITLTGNTFTGNSGSSGSGGGAYCTGGTVTLTGNTFSANSSRSGGGGGVSCSGTAVTLSRNTFTANSAPTGFGGGGANCSGTAVTILANTFSLNSAGPSGGGVYASAQTIDLFDNLVVRNNSSFQGGGIWVDASATLDMINNTISGNTAAGGGGGAAFQVDGTVELLNVYNNIIWGNTASGNGGDVWLGGTGKQKLFLFNDVDSMYGLWDLTQNNIDLAPQFFDPVNGDYHTQITSPCIGAGTTNAPSLPLTDLDGNSRTNAAGLVDMGCYEFNTTATHPADTNAAFVITAAEFNTYAFAWKNGLPWALAPSPIPANYLTRAGYLMTNGGAYHNDGSARPTNWKPGP